MALQDSTWVLHPLSLFLGFALLCCAPGSHESPKFSFPQLAPSSGERAFPDALLEGTLRVSQGCLQVGTEDEVFLIIWPPHIRLDRHDGIIHLLDEKSRMTAEVGQIVRLGGGEIEPAAPILRELREPLPAECPGPYWLASGLFRP